MKGRFKIAETGTSKCKIKLQTTIIKEYCKPAEITHKTKLCLYFIIYTFNSPFVVCYDLLWNSGCS